MYSKLTFEEQGFWFSCGVVLLLALLVVAYYTGPYDTAARVGSTFVSCGVGWIMRDEFCNPHWEDIDNEPESVLPTNPLEGESNDTAE